MAITFPTLNITEKDKATYFSKGNSIFVNSYHAYQAKL